MPPQFQLKYVATDENKRIQTEFLNRIPLVNGVYGSDVMVDNGPTVNCNATAGMDSTEFRIFIEDAIVPLYPNASEQDGKRVLLILDSGPGRKGDGLLSFLAARGFHLLPGVPNTTHVTQPTDQNYRHFKSMHRSNLEKLVHYHRSRNESVSQPDIPLLVFEKRAGRNETLEWNSHLIRHSPWKDDLKQFGGKLESVLSLSNASAIRKLAMN